MDDNCAICGKYYKKCKHYLREHIPDYSGKKALCGRNDVTLLPENYIDIDFDPNDICKHCAKLDNWFQAKFEIKNGYYLEKDDDIYIWEPGD